MPYIITTRTPIRNYATGETQPNIVGGLVSRESRRAVATLEEARAEIRTDLCDWHGATGPDDPAIVATLDLSEASGGTIGPLPDGTMIEVTPVAWNWVIGVADDMGIDTDAVYEDGGDAAIMAAYNAQVTA